MQIRVLDKEYQVQCAPNEKATLIQSAQLLDQRMREARKSGNVIGLERIAIMVALNLSHELMLAETEASLNESNKNDLLQVDRKLVLALKGLDKASA